MKLFMLGLFGMALGNRVQVNVEGLLNQDEDEEQAEYLDESRGSLEEDGEMEGYAGPAPESGSILETDSEALEFENETDWLDAYEMIADVSFLDVEETYQDELDEEWFKKGCQSEHGRGCCVETKMPVTMGGYRHTYRPGAGPSGTEIQHQCHFGPFNNGWVKTKCTNGKWSFSDVRCGRTPGQRWAGQRKARRAAPRRARAKKNAKDKCYALCVRPYTVPLCGRCTHSQQCGGGDFCCPHMKLCISKGGSQDGCDMSRAGNCNGCGSTATSPEDRSCKCGNRDYPRHWLQKKCHCR